MKVAVTNHAVDRYVDRVEGAKGFEREAVRESIRKIVEDGFAEGMVRPHPLEEDRRVVPFKSGESILYLSLGPNNTSFLDADLAVISVLFEHELTSGKVGMGVRLEDISNLGQMKVSKKVPRFVVHIGIEEYKVMTVEDLQLFLAEKKGQDVKVYELKEEP
jgi:hypothetical protein